MKKTILPTDDEDSSSDSLCSSMTSSVLEQWLESDKDGSVNTVEGIGKDQNLQDDVKCILNACNEIDENSEVVTESNMFGKVNAAEGELSKDISRQITFCSAKDPKNLKLFRSIIQTQGLVKQTGLIEENFEDSIKFPSVSNLVKHFNEEEQKIGIETMEKSSRAKERSKRSKRRTGSTQKHEMNLDNSSYGQRYQDKNMDYEKPPPHTTKKLEAASSLADSSREHVVQSNRHMKKNRDEDVNIICCSSEYSGDILFELCEYGVIDEQQVKEFQNITNESERLLKICEVLAAMGPDTAREIILQSKTISEFVRGIFVHRGENKKTKKTTESEQFRGVKNDIDETIKSPHKRQVASGQKKYTKRKDKTADSTSLKRKAERKTHRRDQYKNNLHRSKLDGEKLKKKHVYFSDEALVVKDLSYKTGLPIRYNISVLEDQILPEKSTPLTATMPPVTSSVLSNVCSESVLHKSKSFEDELYNASSCDPLNSKESIVPTKSVTEDVPTKVIHRTRSFPICNSPARHRKKKGVRVSFSSLPPTEFQIEPTIEAKANFVRQYKSPEKSSDKVESNLHGENPEDSSSFCGDKCSTEEKEISNTNNAALEMDEINEMLMDFLEEIEAESITVKDCLKDAVKIGVITLEQAREVVPTFKHRNRKDVNNNKSSMTSVDSPLSSDSIDSDDQITSSELHSHSQTSIDSCPDDVFSNGSSEQFADKLYDLFSGLTLKELTKCREKTLGRLCHLSTYEAYENMQKNAKLSAFQQSESETSFEFGSPKVNHFAWESSSIENRHCTSSESELSEFSTTECDEYPSESEFIHMKSEPTFNSEDFIQMKTILPMLIDEGVLDPRQVWSVLEVQEPTAQARILAHELSKPKSTKVFSNLLHQMPHLKILQESLNKPEIVPPTPLPRRRMSQSFKESKSFDITTTFPKPNQHHPMTSTPRRTVSLRNPKLTLPSKNQHSFNGDLSETTAWCRINNLPQKTADSLQVHGYHSVDDVMQATEDDLEELTMITWMDKARLWVAIENSRLNKNYEDSKNNLIDILNILEK